MKILQIFLLTFLPSIIFFTHSAIASERENRSPKEEIMNYSKPSNQDLKKKLTREQYEVTQSDATEKPFQNAFWNHHEDGIYVDIVTGEPLFSSLDKYDSGTGWPSFTQPIEKQRVKTQADNQLGVPRTEVRSKSGNSHLGHVFDDGPGPQGLRYCINSASLRFVPLEKMKDEGYGSYLHLFKNHRKLPK